MYIIWTILNIPSLSSSSTLSIAHFVYNTGFYQNNFIYCRGHSLLMICSFIIRIFNNNPHLFVGLVHISSLPPKTTPEKWAYHPLLPSTPNSPRKIAFSLISLFRPLSYIPHEKWGYHRLQTSTQNFRGKIGFGRAFQGDLSDYKWHRTDDNYTAVLLMKNRLKI